MKTFPRRFLTIAIFAATTVLVADPNSPKVAFDHLGVAVTGVAPGTRVAWIGITKEPARYHARSVISRGTALVTPGGSLLIRKEHADATMGVWAIADLTTGRGIHAAARLGSISARPMELTTTLGSDTISLASGAVEIVYVRPPGRAWSLSVADGGDLDGDHSLNGRILLPLVSLRSLHGKVPAPSVIDHGDLVLAIDPRQQRIAKVTVP